MSDEQQNRPDGDWARSMASALDPAIPAEQAGQAAAALLKLDAVFQAEARRIPAEELMWDGPDFRAGEDGD